MKNKRYVSFLVILLITLSTLGYFSYVREKDIEIIIS